LPELSVTEKRDQKTWGARTLPQEAAAIERAARF